LLLFYRPWRFIFATGMLSVKVFLVSRLIAICCRRGRFLNWAVGDFGDAMDTSSYRDVEYFQYMRDAFRANREMAWKQQRVQRMTQTAFLHIPTCG
jgi:hypothetical protein